ncbi:malonate decarboxylase holo-ACP synthase [Neobacillus sp. 179-C4.2 HS]|uniref:Malonate decarboxylase holo-ACP synthase n=1 Tax=Neobacillus driksii TaxID=3035913 RepID=A0ABV4YQK2_9BACI|nr:malonate decarboxylase holo-ACP synthase [Neobacillus sp. 179.-C4.2 HS]MDP5195504.1 malonate decarboxylase holo-ACP synthase [Neobacillus sp. 179.-C4.2 HS]
MALDPHDLLKIKPKDIISNSLIPEWVVHSLVTAPFVVVRRVHAPKGQEAIGIRGKQRNQRFGAFLPEHCVIKQIKPEDLIGREQWKDKQAPVFTAMEFAADIFNAHRLSWGPGGSVGFELASGVDTVTSTSDLDLILRSPEPLEFYIAREIVEELKRSPVRVDVQVETHAGAFSLLEYARGPGPVLLKTRFGPKLSSNPWEVCNASCLFK